MKQALSEKKKGFLAKQKTSLMVNPVYPFLAVLPAIVAIVLLSLVPAILNVVLSFTDYNGVLSTTSFVAFKNYINFFTVLRADVFNAIWNTLRYAFMMVLPLQVISLGAALLVNMKFKLSTTFRAIFFLPTILGIAVVCTIWGMMYDPLDGFFAQILALFGKESAFLGDDKNSLRYIVIVALWASFGYSMAIYLAALQGVPTDLYEAASIDGASAWIKFWKITLPLIWGAVTICLFIALQGTLGMSEYIIFLTNGEHNTQTIGFYIYDLVMRNTVDQGQTAAVSLMFFVFTSTIMLLFNKFIRKREVEM